MIKLNPIFADGIVFAANKPIRIFGVGNGHVSVSFLGEPVEQDAQGDWCLELSARSYGGPYTMDLTLDGKNITISDVYVGEVILLAGQSNIEFKMRESKDYPELSETNNLLRLFSLNKISKNDFYDPTDKWVPCDSKEGIKYWSAIGYETGLEVCKKKGCAVGLISCNQGASCIQSWLPAGTSDRLAIHIPAELACANRTAYPAWNGDSALYRAMQQKIVPFSLSHVIWYQGESNHADAEAVEYKKFLTELLRVWREDFKDSELPFIVVQIANYISRMKKGPGWELIQKMQMEIQNEVANVTTVVSKDVCEDDDIHPPTKRYLSKRIAAVINQ